MTPSRWSSTITILRRRLAAAAEEHRLLAHLFCSPQQERLTALETGDDGSRSFGRDPFGEGRWGLALPRVLCDDEPDAEPA